MRDYLLLAIVGVLLPAILVNPVVGAYAWAWVSMMNPHRLTYGFTYGLPIAQAVAITTLVAFAFTRKRHGLPLSSVLVVYVLFLLWMTFTSLFAMSPREQVIDKWIFVMKIHLMLFVTLMLIRDRKQLELLIWVVTFSVAFYGIKGGIWTIITGGGGRVWGPPGGLIEGNNELAVALVMLTPFLYYLYQTVQNRWVRGTMLFCVVVNAFAILGSQSRGALLALLAMALFLGFKGRRPLLTTALVVVIVASAIAFMPDTWTYRMESIGAYEQDGSAMSRIWTWKTLWAAALDRPLVGVGFGTDNPLVFARYAPTDPEFEVFRGRVWVAHSIFFQAMGEHGFVGLALFLLIGVTTWLTAGRVARATINDPEFGSWMPALMRMTQVSLIGYAVGGAFLSLAHLDLVYYMIGYVIISDAIVRRRSAVATKTAPQLVPAEATEANSPRRLPAS
jgi:probable O-glycosylation ligase (exosortase A-associated)